GGALHAQSPYVLRGKLLDSLGETAPYAYINLAKNKKTVISDEKGRFYFDEITIGEDTLTVSHASFQKEKLFVKISALPPKDTLLVRLSFYFKALDPVLITGRFNLDSLLNEAREKFCEAYAKGYESDIFVRCTQQQNNAYTGILEATGTCYDEGLNFKKVLGFRTNYCQFYNARSTGFSKGSGLYANDFSVPCSYHFTIPWNTDLYDKSKKIGNQNPNLIYVTLMPKKAAAKELKALDEKFGFSLYSPPVFSGMKRTYIIDLKTRHILSIELESLAPAMVKYDQAKRKHLARRSYCKFQYIDDALYLVYAKEDNYYTTPPTREKGVWHVSQEWYLSNPMRKQYTDEYFLEKYKVITDKEQSLKLGYPVRLRAETRKGVDGHFHCLEFTDTFNKRLWEAQYIPPFLNMKKILEDLKSNPYIGDFMLEKEK
ncbi:MAG: hypothetical protein CRN43_05425, partial [Candidatus Nephrothrix sp. EaCA]